MTVQPPSHEVKRIVTRAFFELGAAAPSLFAIEETVVRRRGQCVARNYRVERFRAHWDVYQGRVEFYNEAGRLVHIMNLSQKTMSQRVAA